MAYDHAANRTPASPPDWRLRTGARLDDALPRVHRTAARALKIRQLFVRQFHGRAALGDMVEACRRRGLLTGLTPLSEVETVRKVLRPICTFNVWDSHGCPAPFDPQNARG